MKAYDFIDAVIDGSWPEGLQPIKPSPEAMKEYNDKIAVITESADAQIWDIVAMEYPEIAVWPHIRVRSVIRETIQKAFEVQ